MRSPVFLTLLLALLLSCSPDSTSPADINPGEDVADSSDELDAADSGKTDDGVVLAVAE